MANEVEKFDPAQLMQGVKDRIKATFVSLIPDDQWDQMCKGEIEKFFAQKSGGYRNDWQSDFGQVVNNICRQSTEEKVRELLNTEEFEITYKPSNDGAKQSVSEAIKNKLIENAPTIFVNVIDGMVANAILALKNKY